MSKARSAAAYSLSGLVGAFTGGLYAIATGMLSPTWLIQNTGIWFSVTTAISRWVGPHVLPSLPWELLTMVFGILFVIAVIVRYGNQQQQQDQ